MSLICISLINSDVEHLFMYMLAILYAFFGKMSIKVFCPFFNWGRCEGPCRSVAVRSYPSPRSAVATESARLQQRRSGAEEVPHVQGQGRCPRGANIHPGQGLRLRRATPCPRSGAAPKRSYPMPKVRGGSQEEQPHLQGAAAAQAQEDREALLHVQGQEGQP